MTLGFPPQDVRESPEEAILTDLDLVVINDGRFIIGEVKADPSGFEVKQCRALTDIACQVLPDEVVVAAPGTAWPEDIEAMFVEMRTRLTAEGVAFRPLLLEW